jgi:hypothetical protein
VTLREWLGTRQPTPPPELARRIVELAEGLGRSTNDVAGTCLSAAERALPALLAEEPASRKTALDLLAVDALVTYAFEAAASEPDRIPQLASEAMAGLSRPATSA